MKRRTHTNASVDRRERAAFASGHGAGLVEGRTIGFIDGQNAQRMVLRQQLEDMDRLHQQQLAEALRKAEVEHGRDVAQRLRKQAGQLQERFDQSLAMAFVQLVEHRQGDDMPIVLRMHKVTADALARHVRHLLDTISELENDKVQLSIRLGRTGAA